MSLKLIAYRYSKALIDYSNENKSKPIESDMALILNYIRISKEFKSFLKNPSINNEKKLETLRALFAGKICEESFAFLKLIVEKNREDALEKILTTYFDMLDEKKGIVNAKVFSAYELSEAEIEKIKAKIKEITGKNARIFSEINPDLLGGFLIQINDTVIDSSLKRQLEKIREKFRSKTSLN